MAEKRSGTELRKLRASLHALLGIEALIEEAGQRGNQLIDELPVRELAEELAEVDAASPGLLPPFRMIDHYYERREDTTYYRIAGIRAHMARVLGKLQVAMETDEASAANPVIEVRHFPFVQDTALRGILERDYGEAQRAFVAQCWKSVIILAGGAIEAILLDLVRQDEPRARANTKAPKSTDITRWDLKDLIAVCVDMGVVSAGVERLSSPIREYRNLVHPGNELRTGLRFDAEEARIALEVLNIVHRELAKRVTP